MHVLFDSPREARYVRITITNFQSHPSLRAGVLISKQNLTGCVPTQSPVEYYSLPGCDSSKNLHISAISTNFDTKTTSESDCERICSEECECDMYLMEDANTCNLYKNVSDVKLYCGTEAIPSNVSADFYGKIKNNISNKI